MRYWKIRVPSL